MKTYMEITEGMTPAEVQAYNARTIRVSGFAGGRYVTKGGFVKRWEDYARELNYLGLDVVEDTRKAAEKLFEELYKEQS